MSKISPIVLLTIEILAIIFFALALLQLVLRCFFKRSSFPAVSQSNRSLLPDDDAISGSHTLQMQLQQLFHLHDSGGLDRDIIDTLPTFNYKEITGSTKEPFDCAVCLCEFSDGDSLKLLVKCSHAFHVHCIDTWLLSNSTCPLCRGTIGVGPLFAFGDNNMEERVNALFRSRGPEVSEERVFSVRLGKFKSTNERLERGQDSESSSAGCSSSNSSSSPRLDARRCYSMGAFRYIVVEGDLQVRLCRNEEIHGKKINLRSRGDSFSISKTWLWSKKGKLSTSLEANDHVMGNSNPKLVISNQY